MVRSRSNIEHRYRLAVLLLGIFLVAVAALWLSADDAGPVEVLGCVWDRATGATPTPECAQP